MTESLSSLIAKHNSGKVQVKSHFLDSLYHSPSSGRDAFDPKDPKGRRLSHHWQAGSTVSSVALSKSKAFLSSVLDPRSYTRTALRRQKQQL